MASQIEASRRIYLWERYRDRGEWCSQAGVLLNKNRSNVAVYRMNYVAIIEEAPDIAFTPFNSSREMESMNQFRRLLNKSN